ncbi:hypothetical protein ACN42_g3364 [Penicillium freii]|uniref:Uncharacterized protein n=1 Tax=Penicillium freii TaxID=48697 RepID=A0A124GS94_PENFR|nr:hypothetical protein ACN42_g3364 [Penicillium freii]
MNLSLLSAAVAAFQETRVSRNMKLLGSIQINASPNHLHTVTSSFCHTHNMIHTTIGCGKQGFPSAQPYLSHIFCTVNS